MIIYNIITYIGAKEHVNSSSYIASVIASYWVVSISMVYLNKMLLSSDNVSIPAPIFVTWYQCVLTCIICIILGQMGERNRIRGLDSMFNEYPVIVLNPTASTKVLPLSLVFVGMIAFNNICLQYVAVSFYNVARSLSIVFNVIFTYLILGILFTIIIIIINNIIIVIIIIIIIIY